MIPTFLLSDLFNFIRPAQEIEYVSERFQHDKEIMIEVSGTFDFMCIEEDPFLNNTLNYFQSLLDYYIDLYKNDYDFFKPEIIYRPSSKHTPHKLGFRMKIISLTEEQKEERKRKEKEKNERPV